MAFHNYAWAVGWDADYADFENYETTFSESALVAMGRIPAGTVVTKSEDGYENIDGWRPIVLEQLGDPYGITKLSELDAYVQAVFGGWTDEDAELTLRTRDRDGSYRYVNVIAHFPKIGSDYTQLNSSQIRDLKLQHTYVSDATTEEP